MIEEDDKFTGDEETIAEPPSAKFATIHYDPTLNDSFVDLFKPELDSERRYPHNLQRTHNQDDRQEVIVIQRKSFVPSSSAFRTSRNPISLGPNIGRVHLRTRSSGGAVGSSGPGSTRIRSLPFSPSAPNV